MPYIARWRATGRTLCDLATALGVGRRSVDGYSVPGALVPAHRADALLAATGGTLCDVPVVWCAPTGKRPLDALTA